MAKSAKRNAIDNIDRSAEPDEPAKDEVKETVKAVQERSPAIIIGSALAAPFPAAAIKFLPKMVKNNRALAMAYIDARLVMDRLDDVLGIDRWSTSYDILADGSVKCKLSIKMPNGEWISKSDVGSPSEQPDFGDRLKAAFSDSLKRAAVQFGIGRYIYRIPSQWADYDAQKKGWVRPPQLPAFAIPKGPLPAIVYHDGEAEEVEPVAAAATKPEPKAEPKPASPEDLVKARLKDWSVKLSGLGDPTELNAILPQLKAEPIEARGPVWALIGKVAKEDKGWKYDTTEKAFFDPNDSPY